MKLRFLNVSPKILFLKICRYFRIKSKKLVLENYVLEYHIADKDHAEIFVNRVHQLFQFYTNRNHKDTTYPQGKKLDTTLCIDQNVIQVSRPEFFKIWRMWIFLLKITRGFSLNRQIRKSRKKLNSRLFLHSLSQYSHKQKFFWVLLTYWMLNAGILILFYSTRSVLFYGNLRIIRILYLTESDVEHLQKCKLNSTISLPLFPRR